jgi:hypothetical protein
MGLEWIEKRGNGVFFKLIEEYYLSLSGVYGMIAKRSNSTLSFKDLELW